MFHIVRLCFRLHHSIFVYAAGIPVVAGFGDALLGGVVHVGEAKTAIVARVGQSQIPDRAVT